MTLQVHLRFQSYPNSPLWSLFYLWKKFLVDGSFVLSYSLLHTFSKVRKPYTITKQREKWTEEEHQKFLEALKLYGRGWRQIEGKLVKFLLIGVLFFFLVVLSCEIPCITMQNM